MLTEHVKSGISGVYHTFMQCFAWGPPEHPQGLYMGRYQKSERVPQQAVQRRDIWTPSTNVCDLCSTSELMELGYIRLAVKGAYIRGSND